MFTLETELDIAVRSAGPEVEKGGIEVKPGELRRCGIIIPRPPTVGEESGDDSARVEWWRFVQARAKSRPRERRGRTEPGDPYAIWEESSLGERGARLRSEGDAADLEERFNERFGW